MTDWTLPVEDIDRYLVKTEISAAGVLEFCVCRVQMFDSFLGRFPMLIVETRHASQNQAQEIVDRENKSLKEYKK